MMVETIVAVLLPPTARHLTYITERFYQWDVVIHDPITSLIFIYLILLISLVMHFLLYRLNRIQPVEHNILQDRR